MIGLLPSQIHIFYFCFYFWTSSCLFSVEWISIAWGDWKMSAICPSICPSAKCWALGIRTVLGNHNFCFTQLTIGLLYRSSAHVLLSVPPPVQILAILIRRIVKWWPHFCWSIHSRWHLCMEQTSSIKAKTEVVVFVSLLSSTVVVQSLRLRCSI